MTEPRQPSPTSHRLRLVEDRRPRPVLDDALVRTLTDDMLRYARRRMPSADQARDVVQETWASAVGGLERFAGRAPISAWLHAILRRKIADFYRGRRPTALGHEVEDPRTGALDQAMAREDVRRLRSALDELPPRQQEAVTLCAVGALDRDEIARQMGVSRGALRVTLFRGRRSLRDALVRAV